MAGSINLSLSQQFDNTNGRLLSGGKLFFYAAGTTTPQLAYRDSALTLPHPNPITLASDGRVPQFYVADGSIRCRLQNSAGVVQFDQDNILVIGASTGGAVGTVVDPNSIFQTGDVMWLDVSGTRSGWVRDNGRTIGSATSGGSERANSDCQNLFLYLWANYSDTICPVVTGRGANAATDWAANKQITLPNKRGYVPAGLTDMGNSDSGALASVPFSVGSATAAGSLCGEARHTLLQASLPAVTLSASGSVQPTVAGSAIIAPNTGASPTAFITGAGASAYSSATYGVADSVAVNSTTSALGSGGAHNNTPLAVLGTFYRRL